MLIFVAALSNGTAMAIESDTYICEVTNYVCINTSAPYICSAEKGNPWGVSSQKQLFGEPYKMSKEIFYESYSEIDEGDLYIYGSKEFDEEGGRLNGWSQYKFEPVLGKFTKFTEMTYNGEGWNEAYESKCRPEVSNIASAANDVENVRCNIRGGSDAGLTQKQMDKFYFDILDAVKRLGWSTADGFKDCSTGDMKFAKLPMVTSDGEFLVMHTGKSWIKYQQDAFDNAPLCYDMKTKKQYRLDNKNKDCF